MSKARIPYFDFYPSDFMHGVRGLTAQEVGVYTMMLCRIYEENGPVEYHVMRLATYCGMRESTFVKTVEKLIELGKLELVEGKITNHRAEVEISSRANKLKINSKAGKASAKKRQQKQCLTSTDVQQTFNHTDTDNTSSLRSDVKAQAPAKAKRGSRLPDDFEADLSEASRIGLSEADAIREADKFRDYWKSQPGQRGVKLDWQATWRNWCRSAVERKPHRKEPPPKPSTPKNAGEAAYLELQRNGTDDISPEFKQLLFGGDASRDRCEPNTAEIITLESKRYGGF